MGISPSLFHDYAMAFVGTPYVWGGAGAAGIDCSGLAIELLQAAGVLLPGFDDTAQGLLKRFPLEPLAPSLGALLFFGKSQAAVSHVGIALNRESYLEAGGGGSKTTTPAAAARDNAYVRVRPVTWRRDLVAIRMPPFTWE